MRNFDRRWLTCEALRLMGDRYEGVVESVTEQTLRNPKTRARELQAVITFVDGWRLVPNISILRAMIGWFGPDSDAWEGRRITIIRRRVESRSADGQLRVRFERGVLCEDAHARVIPHPAASERNDEGDSEEPAWVTRDDHDIAPTADEIDWGEKGLRRAK